VRERDPIFPAIDAHKIAWVHDVDIREQYSHTNDDALEPQMRLRDEICSDAAFALTEIRPTTIAGVIALLEYVEQFNSGLFGLESGT
jgi:hypothetical protein